MPVMPFESDHQREAYERLREPLVDLFGTVRERVHAIGYVYEVDGETVTSTVAPWGARDTIVANRAYLADAVLMTEEMLRELARWTETGRFGFFGVDNVNDGVYFEHQLVGSTVTGDTLERSMRAVLTTALARRSEFRERFGRGDL